MNKSIKQIKHWEIIKFLLIGYDVVTVVASYFLSLLLRFDFQFTHIANQYLQGFYKTIPYYALIVIIVFTITKLYKSMWRYASFVELARTIVAVAISSVLYIILLLIIGVRMPLSYFCFGIVLHSVFAISIRFAYRFFNLLVAAFNRDSSSQNNIMVIGAGEAGQTIIKDLNSSRSENHVSCIIDDNSNKWGRYLDGIKIVGGRDKIVESVEEYRIDKILIAIPSLSIQEQKKIIDICKDTGKELKIIPSLKNIASGKISYSSLREVSIEDLLGREPVKVDLKEVFDSISGKTIIVTGGGGSIGSELCRQIASHSPERLIIFDVYENNAYDIQLELRHKYPNLKLETIIGSVRDSGKVQDVFKTYKPNLVFHAAAHKHVPLMEDSPNESIKNNVFGTFNVAYAAMAYGAQKMVLISTDKAVNPTNIMGASKRLCEMVIQSFARLIKENKTDLLSEFLPKEDRLPLPKKIKTVYGAVRFGNVLGSNGSVIPIFKKQIKEGGPVTVTHPEMVRYFMTIPEAVSLVLQCGTYADNGEIFVLDMGDPVKIDDLARNLILLSGYKPDVDIKIEYTGLRPGEKMYEERLMDEEGMKKTKNKLINIGKPLDFDSEKFLIQLKKLVKLSWTNSTEIKKEVSKIVTTYKPYK